LSPIRSAAGSRDWRHPSNRASQHPGCQGAVAPSVTRRLLHAAARAQSRATAHRGSLISRLQTPHLAAAEIACLAPLPRGCPPGGGAGGGAAAVPRQAHAAARRALGYECGRLVKAAWSPPAPRQRCSGVSGAPLFGGRRRRGCGGGHLAIAVGASQPNAGRQHRQHTPAAPSSSCTRPRRCCQHGGPSPAASSCACDVSDRRAAGAARSRARKAPRL